MPSLVPLNKRLIQDAGACMRLGYLRVRDKGKPNGKEPSAAERILLHYGKQVGAKARQDFPGGRLIDEEDFGRALAETRKALEAGERILFEAAFAHEGVGMRADVIVRQEGDRLDLFEVKAGTSPDDYYEDVAVQVRILEGLGFQIRPYLMLLDPEATLESPSLFMRIDCDKEVRALLPEIEGRIQELRKQVLSGSLPEVPFTRACRDCDYFKECLPGLPEHSVFTLYRGGKAIDKMLDLGIRSLGDVPGGLKLNAKQARQLEAVRSDKPWVSKDLGKALREGVSYPLHFLDFEAPREPLPRYPGQHPYDLVPFQWSCHVVDAPGSEPRHHDFLMTDPGDPRGPFVESLLGCLGRSGSIVVYSSFEATAIKALADAIPRGAYELMALLPRLVDLLKVIQDHYYHPGFKGGYSIKNVLPVLVPGLSYEGMEVSEGMGAVWAWYELIGGGLSPEERERKVRAMREYCEMDTRAMVEIWRSLGAL